MYIAAARSCKQVLRAEHRLSPSNHNSDGSVVEGGVRAFTPSRKT